MPLTQSILTAQKLAKRVRGLIDAPKKAAVAPVEVAEQAWKPAKVSAKTFDTMSKAMVELQGPYNPAFARRKIAVQGQSMGRVDWANDDALVRSALETRRPMHGLETPNSKRGSALMKGVFEREVLSGTQAKQLFKSELTRTIGVEQRWLRQQRAANAQGKLPAELATAHEAKTFEKALTRVQTEALAFLNDPAHVDVKVVRARSFGHGDVPGTDALAIYGRDREGVVTRFVWNQQNQLSPVTIGL